MTFKSLAVAGTLLGLHTGTCAAPVTPKPTPIPLVDPTWEGIQRTGRLVVGTSRGLPSV